MKVSAQHAQEHFADILTAIDTGEEVELTRPGQPSVRLTLVVSNEPTRDLPRLPRMPGRPKGIIEVPTDEEWPRWTRNSKDRSSEEVGIWLPG
jgi:antitoxin (DNA-binding transcriptional repressor) of toxin-antitoxin stability system